MKPKTSRKKEKVAISAQINKNKECKNSRVSKTKVRLFEKHDKSAKPFPRQTKEKERRLKLQETGNAVETILLILQK